MTVDLADLLLRKVTARRTRLVRDDDHPNTAPVQPRDRFGRTRDHFEPVDGADMPDVMIDRSVAIEEDGHSSPSQTRPLPLGSFHDGFD